MNLKIAIGNDHAGFELKEKVILKLQEQGYECKDFGSFTNVSCDYPDYAHLVADAVDKGLYEIGILICGSGNGVCMVANRYDNVRAALCWNLEIAKLARTHNDANIICIPAKFVDDSISIEMINIFLTTQFAGERHVARVNKISRKI